MLCLSATQRAASAGTPGKTGIDWLTSLRHKFDRIYAFRIAHIRFKKSTESSTMVYGWYYSML